MKIKGPPARGGVDEQRMLPMINLVFLLLIFFMLAGAIAAGERFRVHPPRSAEAAAATLSGTALLVAADGRLALGMEPLSDGELTARLEEWLAEHGGQAVLQVKADADTDAAQVTRLLGRVQQAGVTRVHLLTTHAAP
jgi:biopolymer transport protein ExbD